MVTTNTLNRKINDLKREVKFEKEILKKEKAAIRKEVKQERALIKKERASLKRVKASIKKDKDYVAKRSNDIREMYELYAEENLPKYLIKPLFWIDVMMKAILMGFITYLSYKGMNHSQFTEVLTLAWHTEKEKEENRGKTLTSWSEDVESSTEYETISLTDTKDNKTYLVSKSPTWKIVLDVFIQIFMRIIFAVVIKVGIKALFNQFDFFDNKVSTQAWSAVVVVSGIIVTYSSEKLTNKINLLFGQISIYD